MGAFPNLRFPRVIWIGLNDAEQKLSLVQHAIEGACSPFTAEKPEDRFSGHVTLARVKRIRRSESQVMAGLISVMENRFFGTWTAGEIELLRSTLGKEGARHESIAKLALAGDA